MRLLCLAYRDGTERKANAISARNAAINSTPVIHLRSGEI